MLLQKSMFTLDQKTVPQGTWRSAFKEASWVFLLSRGILLLVTFMGLSVFPSNFFKEDIINGVKVTVKTASLPVPCNIDLAHCVMAWDNWDVGIYTDIAHRGYPNLPDKQSLVAFFPLWPLILHLTGDYFSQPSVALFYVGLILTNICFYFALVLFYQLVIQKWSHDLAKDALFFLALGPYALFFFIGYSESLFLLLVLATFYFLQRQTVLAWWLAGLCGFLASLTRSTGILLTIPFLVLIVQQFWPDRRDLLRRWRPVLQRFLPMLLVPLGLLTYMAYLWMLKGNPLAFIPAEVTWGRHLTFPWVGFINDIHSFFVTPQNFESNFLDFIFTLTPLLTLIIMWKRLPWHYSLYALVVILFSLLHPIQGFGYPLSSSPRFMSVIFPLFILFAYWCQNDRIKSLLMGASVALFTLHALLFICHGWVA